MLGYTIFRRSYDARKKNRRHPHLHGRC
jgi:hypothetical protein